MPAKEPTQRKWPVIVKTKLGSKVHISRSVIYDHGFSTITDCGVRIRNHQEVASLEGMTLCKDCGSKERFEQALAEGIETRTRYDQEREQSQKAEEESRRLEFSARQDCLDRIFRLLNEKHVQVSRLKGKVYIKHGDREFRITVIGKDDPDY